VVLLASNGRLAYFGSPEHMHERFGSANAAELFSVLDEIAPEVQPSHPSVAHLKAEKTASSAEQVASRRHAARNQLSILARRYRQLTFSDRRRSWLFAAQGIVLGVLLLMFVEPGGFVRSVGDPSEAVPISATGMGILLVMCVTWMGMATAIREIVKERQVLVREHRAGLSALAYVGSKIAVLGPLLAVQATVVTVLAVQRQSTPSHGAVLPGVVEIAIAMSLAGISAVSLALFVSATVRTADKALAVLPMLVVVEFVLSGLTPSVSWVPGLAQLRDLAGTRWAVQAVGATVTGNSGSWWSAIGALCALTVVALAGTFIAVHRSLRLPTVRTRRPLRTVVRDAVHGINPEMARLARIGAVGLTGVALVVAATRVFVPTGADGATPVMYADGAGSSSSIQTIGDNLPGVLGDLWWMWDVGTRFGIGVTEAAYLASSTS
jgi:hypothetical protein